MRDVERTLIKLLDEWKEISGPDVGKLTLEKYISNEKKENPNNKNGFEEV